MFDGRVPPPLPLQASAGGAQAQQNMQSFSQHGSSVGGKQQRGQAALGL